MIKPGRLLSDGHGIAVNKRGWAYNDVSIFRIRFQKLLSLLSRHIEEAPAGFREGKSVRGTVIFSWNIRKHLPGVENAAKLTKGDQSPLQETEWRRL